jgi:hypothetical protein
MTWTPLSIAAPAGTAEEIASALPGQISVTHVNPWQHGVRQGTGHHTHLSFPNAVSAVLGKMPAGQAALAVAITAANIADFSKGLAALNAAFPLREVGQCARRAQSLLTLETDKFNLPQTPAGESRTLQGQSLPTLAQLKRAALLQQAAAEAAALPANPLSVLEDLQTAKAAFDATVSGALSAVTDAIEAANDLLAPGTAWRFYADSDIPAALATGHPGHEYTLTAITLFTGSAADLALLAEVLT